MGKKISIFGDNRGGSLILVILSIGFIGILCSLLLFFAVNNIQMKAVDRKSKANFYDAESAFDEIKTGLEEIVASELEEAYNLSMKQYIDKSEEEKKQIFATQYIKGLREKLGGTEHSTSYDLGLIKNLIKKEDVLLETSEGNNQLIIDTSNDENPQYITLKSIKVSYVDSNHYQTRITTDIIIEVPEVSFYYSAISLRPVFSEYSLIADRMISLDTAPMVQVRGNVYAGIDGIGITNGSSLSMNKASNIVTKGDISVMERSSLKINDNPKIWARNIGTLSGTTTESPTTIEINGRCYVADDLMLNASNSLVTINGEYYGYSYETYRNSAIEENNKSAENSSAIIINGAKSSLDLSGLNKLVVAGRAYLDPKSKSNESTSVQGRVQTGEALAVKGNQLAYLVPAEYIWCGQNPVSIEAYNNRASEVLEVDFNKVVQNNQINLKEYIDPNEGYTRIFYQLGDNQNYVYYYLNFQSEEKANLYMKEYYQKNDTGSNLGIIDHNIKGYATSIKINPLKTILSLGNIFTYDSNTEKSKLYENTVDPDAIGDVNLNALIQLSSNLAGKYDALKERLVEISIGEPYDKESIFHTIIQYENIKKDDISSKYRDGIKIVVVDSNYVVYIVDNEGKGVFTIPEDDDLPNRGRKGIVISTGSILLQGEYKGLMIAKDKIILSAGSTVNAPDGILEEIFSYNSEDVNRYFRDYATDLDQSKKTKINELGRIHVSDLINYDNWRKNEE